MLPKTFLYAASIFLSVNVFAQFNPKLKYGKVKDIDGNTYKTIKIGTQRWMAENLRTTKFNDGSKIPVEVGYNDWSNNYYDDTTFPMISWYDFSQENNTANRYGALYNWYAINPATNGNKNVCPVGWHVPSDKEWIFFITYHDSNADVELNNNTVGNKMKSEGINNWSGQNPSLVNCTGFSGLPAGYKYVNGQFFGKGVEGCWWSSTEENEEAAWSCVLQYKSPIVFRLEKNKNNGFSVRCVKD